MIYLFLFVMALLFTAIFTSYEIAYITIQSRKTYIVSEKYRRIFEEPELMLTTILVGTNLGAVATTIFLLRFFESLHLLQAKAIGATGLLSALALLFISEAIPKTLSRSHPESVVGNLTPFIFYFYKVTLPIIRFFHFLALLIKRKGKGREVEEEKTFENLLIEARKEGLINEELFNILRFFLVFKEIKVGEFTIPLNRFETVDIRMFGIKKRFKSEILIVYENTIDNIKGIVELKDVFLTQNIDLALKPLLVVYEGVEIKKVLAKMDEEGVYTALVHDEYGRSVGIFKLEYLLNYIGRVE